MKESKMVTVNKPGVAELIEEAKRRNTWPTEAVDAVKQVLDYNDIAPKTARVARTAVRRMLRETYGVECGKDALESFCKRLGRRSFGEKS